MDRCVNCQFYDRQNKGQGVGQCRRQAPALSPINAKAYMIEGVWPTVRDDDWCGEWKAGGRRSDARVAEMLHAGLPPTNATSRAGAMPAGAGLASAGLASAHSPLSSIRGND